MGRMAGPALLLRLQAERIGAFAALAAALALGAAVGMAAWPGEGVPIVR